MARLARIVTFFAAAVHATPMPAVLERAYVTGKVSDMCKEINFIVTVLKDYRATPFCSSYLGIPVVTSTTTVKTISVTTVKITSTITVPAETTTTTLIVTAPGSTSYVFRPGNPSTARAQKRDQGTEKRGYKPQKPEYLNQYGDDAVSSGCKCLDIPRETAVVSKLTTIVSTSTTTKTAITTPLSASTVTSTKTASASTITLYPCATPVPTLVQTLPYGDAALASNNLGLMNTLFTLSEAEGASAEACCNTCYFGIQNCVQAYFYSYQGCVVAQAFKAGSGLGVSSSCPSGLFSGLTYARDTNPAFRSTGNFAGPCGVKYNNL